MNKRLFEKLTFEMELKNYDKKSMRAYSDSLKRLERHFGKKRLDKLSVEDFRRYIVSDRRSDAFTLSAI